MFEPARREIIRSGKGVGPLRQLPRHHIRRDRLTALLADAPVALVEAGGGYGKSVLAAEYAALLGIATAFVALGPDDDDASRIAVRVAGALRRAGLSDLAAAVGAGVGKDDPLGALPDALSGAGDPVLLVLEDIHHAVRAGAQLLRLARDLPDPHRLVLLARRLPPAAERLRREPGVVLLTAGDLAFDVGDVASLYASGFGVELSGHEAETLVHSTGGWAAALVLAAPRIAEASHRAEVLEALNEQDSVLSYLVHDALESLPEMSRDAMVALAHLPTMTDEAVAAVAERDGLPAAAAEAGLPLARTSDGRWELPGPVRDLLARLGPLPAETARRVAAAYASTRLHEEALDILLRVEDGDGAAALLARLRPSEVESVDFERVRQVVAALPAAAVATHPRVLLQLARACEPAAAGQVRAQALVDAGRLAGKAGDQRLVREIEAETAKDLVRDGRVEEAELLANRLLAELGQDETSTRARLLHTLGRVRSFTYDPVLLAEAEPLLREAASLYELVGEPTWKAQALLVLGSHVQFTQGRFEEALATLDQALGALAGNSRFRAVVLTFKSEVLGDLGRYDELEATGSEASRIGALLGDERVLAYVAWNAARGAAQMGDAAETLEQLREVERHPGDWFEHATGAEFLADAAVLLDRVGETTAARRYLERAKERAPHAEPAALAAEAALEARTGDPVRAERLLADVLALGQIEARDAWRMTMLRAYAALRRGDETAAGLAADAFEQAAAWTAAPIPLLRERALSERLLALAVEAGSPAARRLHSSELPVTVTTLGRFEVRQGGRLVQLPHGRPTALAKLVAARGSVHAEEAIESLWPEVDPESGRKRLRNVLNRLRTATELVIRVEQGLELAGGVEVDARHFEEEARQALSLARIRPADAVTVARTAVARYRGDLLPDDPYEPWASVERERLRGRYVELLDLLVDQAEGSGELDEALRLQRRRLEIDPLDEEQYLRAARLLSAQGRRLAAAEMLRRGTRLLERFGLPQPPAFRELAKTLQT